jgi:hypothetical protein
MLEKHSVLGLMKTYSAFCAFPARGIATASASTWLVGAGKHGDRLVGKCRSVRVLVVSRMRCGARHSVVAGTVLLS